MRAVRVWENDTQPYSHFVSRETQDLSFFLLGVEPRPYMDNFVRPGQPGGEAQAFQSEVLQLSFAQHLPHGDAQADDSDRNRASRCVDAI